MCGGVLAQKDLNIQYYKNICIDTLSISTEIENMKVNQGTSTKTVTCIECFQNRKRTGVKCDDKPSQI